MANISSEKAENYAEILINEKTDLEDFLVKEISDTSANNCFKVDEDYFVKIEHYSGMRSLIYRESVFLDKMELGIETPELVDFGVINGALYRIFEYVVGKSFHLIKEREEYEKLSERTKEDLFQELGQKMALIHETDTFEGSGTLNMVDGEIEGAACDNWYEGFLDSQSFWHERLEENGFSETVERLEKYFEDKKEVLNSVEIFRVVHQQLDLRNIIYTEEETFVIDWEEVIAGDPLMDLVITETILFWFNNVEERFKEEFRNGYTSVRDIEFNQELVEIYRVAEISRILFIFKDHDRFEEIEEKLEEYLIN